MIGSFRFTAIKLSIFTAVTVVVTVWLASVIGNQRFFSSPYQVTAQFSDATGLLRGDVVKAAGVTVGRVEGIEVEHGLARVTMEIDEEVELPRDIGAEIRFRNLVGQRMINLTDPAEPSNELLQAGDAIALRDTEPAFDLTALFNGLRPLIRSTSGRDINIVSRTLVEALRGRSDEVEGILSNLGSVADVLASRDQELSNLLTNLTVVTDDVAARDEQLRSTLSDMDRFFTEVSASREDLSVALTTLDDAATRFQRVIDASDENIEGGLEDLSKILGAVNEKRRYLRKAIRALPEMLVAVERVTSYGEWSMINLVHVCKDDTGECGSRQQR